MAVQDQSLRLTKQLLSQWEGAPVTFEWVLNATAWLCRTSRSG